jgi:hypothetical protein
MMKIKLFFVVGIVVSIGMVNCASVNVSVHYDEEVNFANYKTFYFAPPTPQQQRRTSVRDPLFNKTVLREIKPILEAKGFTEASSRAATDLLVVFYTSVRNEQDYVPPTYRVGRWGGVRRVSPGHVVRYKVGTLVIDVVDFRKKELVWQGLGRGVLDRDKPGENLVEAVEKVLADFPPQ